VLDVQGIFSSLFAMGVKVEKANLCLPSGGQAIFTPRSWVDVQQAEAEPVVSDEIDPTTGQPFDEEQARVCMYDALAVSGLVPFPVAKRLKPSPVDPSLAPKPGGIRWWYPSKAIEQVWITLPLVLALVWIGNWLEFVGGTGRRGAKNWPGLGDVVELAAVHVSNCCEWDEIVLNCRFTL
jgi:hypothetical protein